MGWCKGHRQTSCELSQRALRVACARAPRRPASCTWYDAASLRRERGIGLELAKCCAAGGFDLLIAADEPEVHDAASQLRTSGVQVKAVQTDLAAREGVDELYAAADGRLISALLANAGRGLGHGFLDQSSRTPV